MNVRVRHIGITALDTVYEAEKTAVAQAFIKNNVTNKSISWRLNNTQEVISSSEEFSLDQDESAFVIVESSFNGPGIYPLNF